MAKDKEFGVDIVLSSVDLIILPFKPMVPVPTLGEKILDKIYHDDTHEDVLFVLEPFSDIATTTEGLSVASDVVSDSEVEAKKPVEYPQTAGEGPNKPDEYQSMPDEAETIGAQS